MSAVNSVVGAASETEEKDVDIGSHSTSATSSLSSASSSCQSTSFPIPRGFPSSTVLVEQGAESRIFSSTFLSASCIVKQRFIKQYRHPSLDASISRQRLWSECRSAVRVRRSGVDAPAVYYLDEDERLLVMERIEGVTVKQWMRQREAGEECKRTADDDEMTSVMRGVGRTIAAVHSCGVIHGDLTTSNLMLRHAARRDPTDNTPHLTVIDFGLAHNSTLIEDRAVDLYVLERAFLSTHPNSQSQFDAVLNGYLTGGMKDGSKVLQKLHLVRQRGRKRQMVG